MASLLRISSKFLYVKSNLQCNLCFQKPSLRIPNLIIPQQCNNDDFKGFCFTSINRKSGVVYKGSIFKAKSRVLSITKSLQKDVTCISKAADASNPEGFDYVLTGRNRSVYASSRSKMGFSSLSAEPGDCRRLKERSVHATKRIEEMGKSSGPVDSSIIKRQVSQRKMDVNGDGAFFDICSAEANVKSLSSIQLETPPHLKNKEKMQNSGRHYVNVLRPGMLHLRRYISVADQVKIVEICRKLGLGSGGFYQPGYRNGGKLNLKMMCLGKSWDPQRFGYGDVRPTDGAKPPLIPDEFRKLVERAMQESHTYLKNLNNANLEDMIPSMNPDICIVNFYTESGRLGLHQDKEESKESLMRGLPVVSISIGDSAEFVYGDNRKNVKKLVLESGDVLIFGGCSRHIYHGVTTIFGGGATAPQVLLRKSNLRPGRLNLTFRQY